MEFKAGDTINNGQYEIIKILGQGAYGQTYLAKDKHHFDAQIVIKKLILSTEDDEVIRDVKRRFKQEARMLNKMGKNPQIPEFKAHFEEKNNFFLVQEYIKGCSLREEISKGDRWREEQVIKFLEGILPVLSFVHAQGVVHRDIKPSNLMQRKSDNKIFLIDFGVVKEIHYLSKGKDGSITATEPIRTKGYMAPEQCTGVPQFNSDIYSLGIVCIES